MLHLQNTTRKALWQPRYVIVKENYLFLFKLPDPPLPEVVLLEYAQNCRNLKLF